MHNNKVPIIHSMCHILCTDIQPSMEGVSGQQEVSIIDKDETSEKVVNVVGGFLIEESTSAFPVSGTGWSVGSDCVCEGGD